MSACSQGLILVNIRVPQNSTLLQCERDHMLHMQCTLCCTEVCIFSFHHLRVKDVGETHSKLRQQTAGEASAVVHDLHGNMRPCARGRYDRRQAMTTVHHAGLQWTHWLMLDSDLTLRMRVLCRIMERPFLNARAPSNRMSKRYTLFLVAIFKNNTIRYKLLIEMMQRTTLHKAPLSTITKL